MKSSVYVVNCNSYDEAPKKIQELINIMGGISQFVKNEEKITLKANLLSPLTPDKAVTTHPSIIRAIGELIENDGASATVADSPGAGFLHTQPTFKKLYTQCGLYEAVKDTKIELNMDTGFKTIEYPKGKQVKKIDIINPVLKADGIFNLCKMKTHAYLHMTGAVKNNFGVIPGLSKVGYHTKFLNKIEFCDMLLDISESVNSRLSIMDAVYSIEGEGPGSSGTPRHVGLILASTSELALDIVAGEIMGLSQKNNPILVAAQKRGITPNNIDDINIIGADIDLLRISDYKFPPTITHGESNLKSNSFIMNKLLAPILKQYPIVNKDKCIGCGVCVKSCPKNAITMSTQGKNHAIINSKNCVCCYCCHELCNYNAVEIKKNPIAKLLNI